MRPLEILLATLLAIYLVWPGARRWANVLAGAALVAAFAHLGLEHERWQMAPLYVLTAGCVVHALFASMRGTRLGGRVAGRVVGLVLLVVGGALAALLPVPQLPTPPGPYAIGTLSAMVIDPARKEIFGADPNAPRKIMVQLWYPAEPAPGAATAPWVEHAEMVAPAIAQSIDLPPFFLDHVALSRGHAVPDAPLARTRTHYPILLFSHGWGGFRQQSTRLMETLASYGYVVLSVDHPYDSALTVFPDGTVIAHNPATLPADDDAPDYEEAAHPLMAQRAGDLGLALDYLTALNVADPVGRFTDHLDLTRVGVLGHSTGGGAVVEFCAKDPRCQAGLTMDAFLRPVDKDLLAAGLRQPFMYMVSEGWRAGRNNANIDALYARSAGPAYRMDIAGTGHYDFSDMPLFSPIASYIGLKGPLAGTRVARIVDDYSVAFLNYYLQGEVTTLLDGPHTNYPEVTFIRR